MSRMFLGSVALASLVLLGGIAETSSASIIKIADYSASAGDLGTGAGDVANLKDGSLAPSYIVGANFDDYVNGLPSHDAMDTTNSWSSAIDGLARLGFIQLDLGSVENIMKLSLVNQVTNTGNGEYGFTTVRIETSDDDVTYNTVLATQNLLTNTLGLQTFDVTDSNAQYIRLYLQEDFLSVGQLGEVIVGVEGDAVNPVPEPATIAIWSLIGGVGLIGYRRRKMSKKA